MAEKVCGNCVYWKRGSAGMGKCVCDLSDLFLETVRPDMDACDDWGPESEEEYRAFPLPEGGADADHD